MLVSQVIALIQATFFQVISKKKDEQQEWNYLKKKGSGIKKKTATKKMKEILNEAA